MNLWIAIPTTLLFATATKAEELVFSVLKGSEGLCSPRKLTIYNDKLYIAESGIGAENIDITDTTGYICYEDLASGNPSCLGATSKVSALEIGGDGVREDVLFGLFSTRPISGFAESHATGAQHATFDNNGQIYTITGLGLNGTQLEADGVSEAIGDFGSVLEGFGCDVTQFAAPWAYEFENDYDGSGDATGSGVLPVPNSNPYHLLIRGDLFYVADAGCNCIMVFEREADGLVSCSEPIVLVLPKITGLDAIAFGPCTGVQPPRGPPFCGQYQNETGFWKYDVEFVPTSIRERLGTSDKIYVSALAGALWTEPRAVILEYELDANGIPVMESATEVPGGPYWAVADFEFEAEDTMYVLEANPGGLVPFSGRLTRVSLESGNAEILAETSLYHPTGIAIHDGFVFLSNHTYNPGDEGRCEGHVISAAVENQSDGGVKCPARRS